MLSGRNQPKAIERVVLSESTLIVLKELHYLAYFQQIRHIWLSRKVGLHTHPAADRHAQALSVVGSLFNCVDQRCLPHNTSVRP